MTSTPASPNPATEPRSAVRVTQPTRPGNGTSRTWSRVLRGVPYRFTAVTMPNGERRYYADRYNGYGDDGTDVGRRNGMRFGCAWSRAGAWIVPVDEIAAAERDARQASAELDAMHRDAALPTDERAPATLVQFTMYTHESGQALTGPLFPVAQLDRVTARYWHVAHESGPWVIAQSDLTDREGHPLTVAAYRFTR